MRSCFERKSRLQEIEPFARENRTATRKRSRDTREEVRCLLEQGAQPRERLLDDSFRRAQERHAWIVSVGPKPRQVNRCEVQHETDPEQQEAVHEILGKQRPWDVQGHDIRGVQIERGEGVPAEKVREMIPSWIIK